MRSCSFCSRWFKNKQAIRRHLGYCQPYLTAERPTRPWTRVPLVRCTSCVATLGLDNAQVLTEQEQQESIVFYGGCPTCSANTWEPAGWKRLQKPEAEDTAQ